MGKAWAAMRSAGAARGDAAFGRGPAGVERAAGAVQVDDQPSPEAKTILDDPELAAYRAWQHEQVVSLSAEIRDVIRQHSPSTEVRHFAAMAAGENAGIDAELMATCDTVLTGYAANPGDVAGKMATLAAIDQPAWGMIRAIQPEVTDPAQIAPLVSASYTNHSPLSVLTTVNSSSATPQERAKPCNAWVGFPSASYAAFLAGPRLN